MKFSLTTEPVTAPKVVSNLEVAELTNDIMTAYESLDEQIRGLNEVSALMDNIHTSLELLGTYGDSAIAQLNIDKGLEELLGVPEKMITAQKAVEGLGDKLHEMWKAFVEWVKSTVSKILEFFTGNSKMIQSLQEQIKKMGADISKMNDIDRILDFGVNVKFDISPTEVNKLEDDIYSIIKDTQDETAKSFDFVDTIRNDKNLEDLSKFDNLIETHKDNFEKLHSDYQKILDSLNNGSIVMRSWKDHGYNSGKQVLETLNKLSNILDHLDDVITTGMLRKHIEWYKSDIDSFNTAIRLRLENDIISNRSYHAGRMVDFLKSEVGNSIKLSTYMGQLSSKLSHMVSILNANLIRQLNANTTTSSFR